MTKDRREFAAERLLIEDLGARFKVEPPPSAGVTIAGGHVVFSRLRNTRPQPGVSGTKALENAFTLMVPIVPTRFAHCTIDGKPRPLVQTLGSVQLYDLTSDASVDLQTRFDNVRLYFSQEALDGIAHDKGLRRIGGLRAGNFDDAILYHLGASIAPALLRPEALSTALVEYLALAAHDHVLRTYAGSAYNARPATTGLEPWQLRRACDFIEDNLDEDPSIAALSRECALSQSYFIRAFRLSTGMTPHRWITRRRIARAKFLLLHSGHSLPEIALMCGFADQSHLGRAFARLEGQTPARWRGLGPSAAGSSSRPSQSSP